MLKLSAEATIQPPYLYLVFIPVIKWYPRWTHCLVFYFASWYVKNQQSIEQSVKCKLVRPAQDGDLVKVGCSIAARKVSHVPSWFPIVSVELSYTRLVQSLVHDGILAQRLYSALTALYCLEAAGWPHQPTQASGSNTACPAQHRAETQRLFHYRGRVWK